VKSRSSIIIGLVLLFLVDLVIPFLPILGIVSLVVAITRPPWFIRAVHTVYSDRG